MDIIFDEFNSTILFSPDYLPDVLQWFENQPQEDGHISKACMKKILHVIDYSCWKLFLRATEGPCELTQEDLVAAEYKLLTETGIARIEAVRLLGERDQMYNLTLTDEAREIFSTFDLEQIKRDKLRNCAVHLIAAAAVNAYGAIEENVFIDLFNRSAKKQDVGCERSFLLKPDELKAIIAPYTELRIDVLLVNGYLVNRMLYNGDSSDIPRFLSSACVDKYYPFDIESLLAYTDSNYFEMTPQINDFLAVMEARFPEISKGDLFLLSLLFVPCYLHDWTQIIDVQLCPMLRSLQEKDQAEIVVAFVRAKHSARSWRFKGFSEDEIAPDREEINRDVREFMKILEGR